MTRQPQSNRVSLALADWLGLTSLAVTVGTLLIGYATYQNHQMQEVQQALTALKSQVASAVSGTNEQSGRVGRLSGDVQSMREDIVEIKTHLGLARGSSN